MTSSINLHTYLTIIMLPPLQSPPLWNYSCTLGSSITAQDSTDSATPSQPGVIRVTVDGEITQAYFCQTAPPWNPGTPGM